jgi:hypothetical protein
MPSMSYCKFENTSGELSQCLGAMEEATTEQELLEGASEYERSAYERLAEQCEYFVRLWAELKRGREG